MRVLCVVLLVWASAAWGDSPITSTDFATAYAELPAVAAAKGMEALEGAPLELLLSKAPNDQKLAVANALGWGKGLAPQFLLKLARARGFDAEKVTPLQLAAPDAFVLGYLAAEDDYLELKPLKPGGRGLWGVPPEALLRVAAQALPDDFAVQYVAAIVQVQNAVSGDWCTIFKVPEAVVKRFPAGKRNLRPGALEAARGYLQGYEESCPKSKAAAQKSKDELNQIYSVSRLGSLVITGTQGGVVVWAPPSPTPRAVHPGFICTGLALGDRFWAGCRDEVLRWDGEQFKSYLPEAARDGTYFVPMKGPGGAVWVRHGVKTYAWDPTRDAFTAVKTPWRTEVYSALVRSNGEVCWVDFLTALHCGGKTMPLKSADYPGGDPRSFEESADGTVWVQDFEGGVYKLGADGRFVHVTGLDEKGSGVAQDAKGQRLYLLHYTNGLEVVRAGKPNLHVGAETLQYVRAMMLDPDGTVWLGGWTELWRLSPDGDSFGRTAFRVR